MTLFGLKVRSFQFAVPGPLILYAVLSVLDFGFTLIAFKLGFQEGNPILAWYAQQGLFEVAKIGTIVTVVLIGFLLWELRIVRGILKVANFLMIGVVGFHLVNLVTLLFS
jgi:hypothetical protein